MKKIYFLVWIVILICLIGGCKGRKNPSKETSSHKRERILFERDLKNLVKQGYFVVVDKNESDAYIQENLFGKDLQIVESLARIKSENLGTPLFIEDEKTLGNPDYILKINPIDRQATHTFMVIETQLLDPSYFSQKKYLDKTYNRAEAMDKKKTTKAMIKFIEEYPDSIMVPRAISYIEYQECAVKRDPKSAIKIYTYLAEKFPKNEALHKTLAEYRQRAEEYERKYKEEAENEKHKKGNK